MTAVSLYIHIPFCAKKCPYCHFYKELWAKDKETAFIDALLEEMAFYQQRFGRLDLKTIFLGGGTPNLLKTSSLKRLFQGIREHFHWPNGIEVTMEMNPGLSSVQKFKSFLDLGVNRASLGFQSFNDTELKFLGRDHTAAQSEKSLLALKEAGFKNISGDLIFAVKGSTVKSLSHSLDRLLAHDLNHISSYNLTVEPGTPFKRRQSVKLDDASEHDQFQLIIQRLKAAGYQHYEVSNFSKPGKDSQHNMAYWDLSPYIGLGPGAHSFFNGGRYHHARDLSKYVQNPTPRAFRQKQFPKSSQQELMSDYMLCQLRVLKGISFAGFKRRFGCSFQEQYGELLPDLEKEGFLRITKDRLRVTEKGLMHLDSISSLFLQ